MGLLDTIFSKHAEISASREVACEIANKYITDVDIYINSQKCEFISVKYGKQVQDDCIINLD